MIFKVSDADRRSYEKVDFSSILVPYIHCTNLIGEEIGDKVFEGKSGDQTPQKFEDIAIKQSSEFFV